jgi:hypothetical protein
MLEWGAEAQALCDTCRLPLSTSYFPHHLPLLFSRRRELCLDMVSSGGLSPLPKRPLYLSSEAPQILTVLSWLPLARELASGLHVTVVTLRFR